MLINDKDSIWINQFNDELEEIETLSETPEMIRNLAITAFDSALKKSINFQVKQILANSRSLVQNIEKSSIDEKYKIIYNQMLILAVSSLETTLKKYFSDKIIGFTKINKENKKLEEIKITAKELLENNLNYENKFSDLLLEKENSSFQNLKKIKEVFNDYLNIKISLDQLVEGKVIYYLELRHILVHRSGKIDDHFLGATKKMSANIGNYKSGDKVLLSKNDWKNIKEAFAQLLKSVLS